MQIIPAEGPPVTVNNSRVASISVGNTGIRWTMPRPAGHQVLRVQDVMVYNIVHWVNWTRPIYFAITVGNNRIGLDPYLRMQGPVFQVVDRPNMGLDIERSKHNLNSICRMSFMSDPNVYQYENMHMFASNYRVAYLQLADAQMTRGDFEAARASFDSSDVRLPWDWRGAYSAARIAFRGPGQAQMRDLSRRYGRLAGEILLREASHADYVDVEHVEGARAISQVLRFSNDAEGAAELLAAFAGQVAAPHPLSGIGPASQIGLLYDAGSAMKEAGNGPRAVELLQQCRALLAMTPQSGPADAAFREMYRMDMATFSRRVDVEISEAEAMPPPAAVQPDTTRQEAP